MVVLKVIGGGDGELFTRGSGQYRYRTRTGTVPVDTIFSGYGRCGTGAIESLIKGRLPGLSQAAHPRQDPRSVGKQEGLDMDDVLYASVRPRLHRP